MPIHSFKDKHPQIAGDAFIAPGAQIIGDVVIGRGASIWYNSVLRGDLNEIRIGDRTNIQDGTIVHVAGSGQGTYIGADVLVGHLAILHACTVHDHAFIGLGSIVMDDCIVESRAMLAAGALLTPGKRIPSGQMWGGRPARHMRDLTDDEIAGHALDTARYVELGRRHARRAAG